ncbi:hypothetical protein CPB97_004135 [Podila verticillata]|nr:hypothetical protein CPB97_004135 [Podila verticillata]
MTTLTLSEYQERTCIKQIGDFTLSCDRSQFSENESELSAAEESEALDLLEHVMDILKKYLYIFAMRRSNPLFVDTKSGKRVHFVVMDEHWKNWVNVESERLDKEWENKEAEKAAKKEAEKKAKLGENVKNSLS